jgi:hypothetical protein
VNSKEWQAIEQAKDLLQLGSKATLAEIKQAYHRQSKLHHPDVAGARAKESVDHMYRLTAAYELLMRYCSEFRFPLQQQLDADEDFDIYDPEDWWQSRFGQDPLWSGKKRQR